jgi:C4-dicarboxylate-specific signal transduction histidine kinase
VIVSSAGADERSVARSDESQLLWRTAELANAAASLREGVLEVQNYLAAALGWTAVGCRIFGSSEQKADLLADQGLPYLEIMEALSAEDCRSGRNAIAGPVIVQVEDGARLAALLAFWPGPVEATAEQLGLLAKVARQLAMLAQRDVCRQGVLAREFDILRQGQLAGMTEAAQSLSHELSQPLAALAAYAGALRRCLDGSLNSSAEIIYLGERLLQQVERAGDILQATKSFILQRTCATGSVDVETTVRQLLKSLYRPLRAASVELLLDIAPGLPPARGSESHVAQIILSLLANAVAALQPVAVAHRQILIRVARAEREVRISVVDAGHHAAGDTLEGQRPFYTAYSDSAQVGLAISRSLAEIQGGRLWKEEQDGETTFVVALPIIH